MLFLERKFAPKTFSSSAAFCWLRKQILFFHSTNRERHCIPPAFEWSRSSGVSIKQSTSSRRVWRWPVMLNTQHKLWNNKRFSLFPLWQFSVKVQENSDEMWSKQGLRNGVWPTYLAVPLEYVRTQHTHAHIHKTKQNKEQLTFSSVH